MKASVYYPIVQKTKTIGLVCAEAFPEMMRYTSLLILTLILLGCGPDIPDGVTVISKPALPWNYPDSVKVTAIGTSPDLTEMPEIPEVGSNLQNLEELKEALERREWIRKHRTKPIAVDPVHEAWLEKHDYVLVDSLYDFDTSKQLSEEREGVEVEAQTWIYVHVP